MEEPLKHLYEFFCISFSLSLLAVPNKFLSFSLIFPVREKPSVIHLQLFVTLLLLLCSYFCGSANISVALRLWVYLCAGAYIVWSYVVLCSVPVC